MPFLMWETNGSTNGIFGAYISFFVWNVVHTASPKLRGADEGAGVPSGWLDEVLPPGDSHLHENLSGSRQGHPHGEWSHVGLTYIICILFMEFIALQSVGVFDSFPDAGAREDANRGAMWWDFDTQRVVNNTALESFVKKSWYSCLKSLYLHYLDPPYSRHPPWFWRSHPNRTSAKEDHPESPPSIAHKRTDPPSSTASGGGILPCSQYQRSRAATSQLNDTCNCKLDTSHKNWVRGNAREAEQL